MKKQVAKPGIESPDEVKQQAREAFNDRAEHYALERERLPYFQAQLEIVLRMLDGEGGQILDIGCAAGGEIPMLQRQGFSVVGVDLSPEMLRFAHRRFAATHHVLFCQADIEHLPFASGSMDDLVCLGVLEYLPDYSAALTEINRVLRPGGLAVLALPTSISLYNISDQLVNHTLRPIVRLAKRILGRRKPKIQAGRRLGRNLCIPWKFRTLLRQHGFSPARSRYSNFFVYPLDRFPKVHVAVAEVLEPLASIPLVRNAASVYLVSARKNQEETRA
jgi:ubiquinone/menaquinone biosynthesis C-methylase UbiE